MKKIILVAFVLLFIPLTTACSPSAISENAILNSLKYNPVFSNFRDITINSFDITKRQIDKNTKTDNVWVTIFGNSEYIECELTYHLTYTLNDKEWVLDSVSRDQNGVWSITPLKPISQDEIDDFVANLSSKNDYHSIQLINRGTDLNNAYDRLTYSASKNFTYLDETYKIQILPIFNKETGKWELPSIPTISVNREWKFDKFIGSWNAVGSWTLSSAERTAYSENSIETSDWSINITNATNEFIESNVFDPDIDQSFDGTYYVISINDDNVSYGYIRSTSYDLWGGQWTSAIGIRFTAKEAYLITEYDSQTRALRRKR